MDPKNDFDAKAIAVQIDGLKVGYIPRLETAEFHKVFNQYKLDALAGTSRSFHASITGEFSPQNYPTAANLVLKKNAQVMFVRNDTEKSRRWYNGSTAKITDLHENSIELSIHENSLNVSIQRSTWDTYKYFYDKEKDTLDCLVT